MWCCQQESRTGQCQAPAEQAPQETESANDDDDYNDDGNEDEDDGDDDDGNGDWYLLEAEERGEKVATKTTVAEHKTTDWITL